MENALNKELREFMEWFKENHPDLYEKYSRNIEHPNKIGGGVTITPSWRITQEEQQMLIEVARTYYERP